MSLLNFSNATFAGLNFSNISASQTGIGSFNSLVDSTLLTMSASNVPTTRSSGFQGLTWSSFESGALAPGSSTTVTFNYDVSETSSGLGINGLQQAITVDTQVGTGLSLTAVEYVYDTNNNLVAQSTINLANPSATAPLAAGDFGLSAAYTSLHVQVVVTAAVDASAVVPSAVNFSIIDQGFHQTTLANQAGLGDTVWNDANHDGIQDNGETGVAGVTVNLLDANGNTTGLTTTTDANGNYSFNNLNAGTYEVQFVPPVDSGFTITGQGTAATDSNADQTTGITGPVVLTAGEFDNTIDAGLVTSGGSHDSSTAALGDYVFADANANGVQDAGDTGISGVTVQLLDATGTNVLATTTTDSTGHYAFTSLLAGTYEVGFIEPANANFSPTGQGTPATDSNPDQSTGITGPIVLTDGQVDNTIDAGLYQTAALGDYVFADANGNGIQDSGDTGVSGVTVNLLDSSGDILAGTTTDATGHYGFSSLMPGVYEVQFVAPVGASFSPTGHGTVATDSNPNTVSGITGPITLSSGQTDNTIDAGLILPNPTPPPATAQLGDRVWYDCNANGIQDSGDTGVANVTVNLLDATGATVLATTTTNSNGLYLFSSLNAGVYEVQFVAPTGKSFTAALQGSNRATDSNANTTTGITAPITLATGQTDLTIDAGLVNTPNTAKLGDLVFQDCNGNGIQDAGESGVSCVTVKLLNSSGSVLRTTTTDSSGHYLFSNLAAGTYEVQFVSPNGMKFTTALAGSNTAIDSNPNAAGLTAPITLAAGQTDLTIDAGLYKPASLGNLVFCDANGNGVLDSCESGVSGVTVKLLNSTGSSVLATTTTNSAGQYSFTNLIPGVYEVQFVAPSGTSFTAQGKGYNNAIDSNPNASTGITGPITLSCGENDCTIDAGLIKTPNTAKIGDFVFKDSNHNGIQDAGESGISGITVKLLNATGSTVLATTMTNGAGQYQFSNLAAGSYVVQFVTPGSYTLSPSLRGTDTAKDSDASTTTGKTGVISLAAGQTNLTIDAGMYQNSTSCGGWGGGGGNGCGGWTYYNDSNNCGPGGNYGYGGYGGGYSGGNLNCGYGSSTSWCSSSSHSGGQYSGGGNWGGGGWSGSGWTGGGSDCSSGPGELQSICGNVKQVEFTYHNCDTVSSDAWSCGVGSSSGHNGQSMCFIQITDKSGDHSWGANVLCQGTLSNGDKIDTSDLTGCGGQLYAHIYASQADCNAGRSAIQEISFNASGSHDMYLGQQVGSLCLTGYSGTQGSAYTNW